MFKVVFVVIYLFVGWLFTSHYNKNHIYNRFPLIKTRTLDGVGSFLHHIKAQHVSVLTRNNGVIHYN